MTGFIEHRENGKYYARWRDPWGRLKAKSFARKRDAKDFLAAQQTAIARGVYVDDRAGKMSFAEWAEHYFTIARPRLARTTYARDRALLDRYVLPPWGRMPLAKITRAAVDAWLAELAGDRLGAHGRRLSPGSVEKIYQVFRKTMAAAYDEERIPRLPCPKHPPIPRGKQKPVRFLTEGEVAHLASIIDPSFEAMILVAAYGGFRIGELCALRLDDVDWTRGFIRVDEGLTDVSGYLKFEAPKTDRAARSVPIADPALDRLRVHIEATIGWSNSAALLFTGRDGGVLRPTNWRRRFFNPAIEQAGLSPLTPHDLRHTAASFFIAEGANQWMLAEILGHRDTRMIDRVYGHLFDKDRQELRARMSRRAREADRATVHRLSNTG